MQKKNTFVVNEKEYKAAPFDFNMLCDLEEMGVSLTEMTHKPMSAVRAYFAACIGGDRERAGAEIEKHIIGGGDMSAIIEAMDREMEESDFFRALGKETEAGDPEGEESKAKKGRKTSQA